MSRKKYVAAVGIAVPLMLGVAGPAVSAQPVEMQLQVATVQAQAGNRLLQDTQSRPALDVLGGLEIKGRAPKTGYTREEFGPSWADVDNNECDTRNDILLRDLSDVVTDSDCTVESGVLLDPYTGDEIVFTQGRDSSREVPVDHVVALSDAWQKGAQQISEQDRLEFANDPLNLLAVSEKTNSQKSDSDAASWLPPNKSYRCEFVARQVAVKDEYNLWVTQAEYDAIDGILQTCPDQMTPTRMMDQVGVGSAQAPEPTPSTTAATIAPEPEVPNTLEQPAPEQLPAEPAQPEQFEAQPEELAVTGTSATGMIAAAVSLVLTALAGVGLARRHDKKAV